MGVPHKVIDAGEEQGHRVAAIQNQETMTDEKLEEIREKLRRHTLPLQETFYATEVMDLLTHIESLNKRLKEYGSRCNKLAIKLREECPDVDAIIVQRNLLAKWHGEDLERIETLIRKRNDAEEEVESLKQERDKWKEDSQKLVAANLKKDKALASAERVIKVAQELYLAEAAVENIDDSKDNWRVFDNRHKAHKKHTRELHRHRESHPAEEGEK